MNKLTKVTALCALVLGSGYASANDNTDVTKLSQPSISWPAEYTPGTTDNFSSNEVIVEGLTVNDVWPYLVNTSEWPKYYKNASDIHFYKETGPLLSAHSRFRFTTFGFLVESQVVEFQAPTKQQDVARIAWHGWVEGDQEHRLDVHHAWLLQNLPGHRVRILTQESQTGEPAKTLATSLPNPMINAHQDWLNGLVKAAKKH
ncbi:TPA: SRPBCC domain-containing protein [Vibrio cholerae]